MLSNRQLLCLRFVVSERLYKTYAFFIHCNAESIVRILFQSKKIERQWINSCEDMKTSLPGIRV